MSAKSGLQKCTSEHGIYIFGKFNFFIFFIFNLHLGTEWINWKILYAFRFIVCSLRSTQTKVFFLASQKFSFKISFFVCLLDLHWNNTNYHKTILVWMQQQKQQQQHFVRYEILLYTHPPCMHMVGRE